MNVGVYLHLYSVWTRREAQIKIYSNFLFLNSYKVPRLFIFEPVTFQFNNGSVAYAFANKYVHEIEMGGFLSASDYRGGDVNQEEVYVRYLFGEFLSKSPLSFAF